MRGKLFTAASVMSLMLCISSILFGFADIACVIDRRNVVELNSIGVDSLDERGHAVELVGGRLALVGYEYEEHYPNSKVDGPDKRSSKVQWRCCRVSEECFLANAHSTGGWMGFATLVSTSRPSTHMSEDIDAVIVPLWFSASVSGVLPCAWLLTRRRRSKTGCITCGYDLTGNTSGVCPECGSAVARKAEE